MGMTAQTPSPQGRTPGTEQSLCVQELRAGRARLLTWGMKAEKTEVFNLNSTSFGICQERTGSHWGRCGTEEPMASPSVLERCHV